MCRVWAILVAIAVMLATPAGGIAKRNGDADGAGRGGAARTEVVVFEINGCKYCADFRDNLGARYLASTTNRSAPLRYVDLGKLDPQAFQLRSDVNIVPTIVLMQDGREVDRVEGYPLPEILFGMVKSRVGVGEQAD